MHAPNPFISPFSPTCMIHRVDVFHTASPSPPTSVHTYLLAKTQRKSAQAFLDIFGEEPGYDRIARVVVDELVKRVEGYH